MTRAADTSRVALASLQPTVAARAAAVLDALQRYWTHHRIDPTSYELLQWMRIENPTLDLNAVRPRLTELRDAGRVQTTGKRVCAVTEKRVYVWAVTSSPVPAPYVEQPRIDPAVQEALF